MEIRFSKTDKKYGCFSNFYPCKVEFDGIVYQNSEAAWQAQKTLAKHKRMEFSTMLPSEAKRAGRRVTLREDWESIKYDLMVAVLEAKFTQNKELGEVLKSTGDATIVEDTTGWHDNLCGSCSCPRCDGITGQNLLGKALMQVRDELNG